MQKFLPAGFFALLLVSCGAEERQATRELPPSSMTIESPAFGDSRPIPPRYTCDEDDVNPPLMISGVPKEAKSLALILDDPDAPAGTWTHWVLWNIDPTVTEIPEGSVPRGGVEGTTSAGKSGYGGPCPPGGTHHYVFYVFALRERLALPATATVDELQAAMEGLVVAEAELTGVYQRQ